MNLTEQHEIKICSDCLDYWANGTENLDDRVMMGWATDADRQRIIDQTGIDDGWDVSLGAFHPNDYCDHDLHTEDCPRDEGSFSWQSCDACRSTLGGQRYPAVVWRTLSETP